MEFCDGGPNGGRLQIITHVPEILRSMFDIMTADCVCPELLILPVLDQSWPDGQKALAGFR